LRAYSLKQQREAAQNATENSMELERMLRLLDDAGFIPEAFASLLGINQRMLAAISLDLQVWSGKQ